MALQFQVVSIEFTQGMETREDKKLVIPSKWNLLQNCNLSTSGALSKRDGVAPMLASAVGNGLALFKDELLAINGTNLSSISSPGLVPATTAPRAIVMPGQVGFVEATKTEIARGGDFPEGADVAHGAGFTCYVWATYTAAGVYDGVYMTLLDEATGTRVIQKTLLNVLGVAPRVVFALNSFFIFYISPAAGTLNCRVITTTAGVATLGAAVALVTSVNLVNKPTDACEFAIAPGLPFVGVSFVWADGVTSVQAILVSQVAGVPAVITGPVPLITEAEIPNASVRGLGVCLIASSSNFATFVFASAGGATSGTVVKILDITFASAAAFLQIDATLPTTAGACHVCAVGQAAFPTAMCFTDQQSSIAIAASVQPLRRTEISFSGGIITVILSMTLNNSATGLTAGGAASLAPPRGPFIAGKPIAAATWDSTGAGALVKGALLLPVAIVENYATATAVNTLNLQPTIFLMDGATGVVVAKALYGQYGVGQPLSVPLVYTPSSTPFVQVSGTSANFSSWALVSGERGVLQFSSGIPTTQNGVVRITFIPHSVTPPIDVQLGAATYLAGGSLSMYDAQGVTEVGFPLFPEGIQVVVSAGGALTAGTYSFVVVYEWVDGQGQRHQSRPSLPVSGTTAAGNLTITVTAPTLLISQKPGVSVVLYATQDAGTIFNRVTPMATPVLNTTAAVSVVFPALAAATSITAVAGNELLYTQPLQSGTTLPSDAPGPTSTLGVHQNRLFVDVTDKPGAYRFSQQLLDGTGLQWNATLGGTVPVDGGDIVGFAAMDEKVLIFCERKIYVVVGNGPTPNGGFSNYSEPIEIPGDCGCADARTILKMPNGIVFKASPSGVVASSKGWHRVGRDLTVQYIGSAVTDYDLYTVFSACYVEDRKEARFSCGVSFHFGTGNELGTTLIYSYLEDQWSISVINVSPPASAARTLMVYDAVWWAPLGVYMSISLADGLCRDTPGVFIDTLPITASDTVVMTARTAFLHLPQLEGFQRVRWLYLTGSFAGAPPAISGIQLVVDYDDVYSAVTPIATNGSYTTTAAQTAAVSGTGRTIDFRHKLHRQKCKSVAFTFSNMTLTDAFKGITGFEALAIEVGVKKGVNRLAATQTVA